MRGSIALGMLVGAAGCFSPDPLAAPDTESGMGSTGVATADGTTMVATTTPEPTVGETSGGPVACEVCVADAPEEWFGPLAVGSGESAPSCDTPFSVIVFEAAQDIAADDPSCACSCGDATVDCTEISLRSDNNTCVGAPVDAETYVGADTCHETAANHAGASSSTFFLPLAGTEACPPNATVEIPTATMTELILCGGAFDQDTCSADEVCVGAAPGGFESALCIAREGDHACPDSYPNARSAFTDVADDRRCTSCDCTPAEGFACEANLELFDGPACAGGAVATSTGACFDTPASFRFAEPTVTGSCTPSAVEPQGSIAGEDPITICCQ